MAEPLLNIIALSLAGGVALGDEHSMAGLEAEVRKQTAVAAALDEARQHAGSARFSAFVEVAASRLEGALAADPIADSILRAIWQRVVTGPGPQRAGYGINNHMSGNLSGNLSQIGVQG